MAVTLMAIWQLGDVILPVRIVTRASLMVLESSVSVLVVVLGSDLESLVEVVAVVSLG